jgi:hypothetical protein
MATEYSVRREIAAPSESFQQFADGLKEAAESAD